MIISDTFPTSLLIARLSYVIYPSFLPPPLCNIPLSFCPPLPFTAVSSQIWRNLTVKNGAETRKNENGGRGGRKGGFKWLSWLCGVNCQMVQWKASRAKGTGRSSSVSSDAWINTTVTLFIAPSLPLRVSVFPHMPSCLPLVWPSVPVTGTASRLLGIREANRMVIRRVCAREYVSYWDMLHNLCQNNLIRCESGWIHFFFFFSRQQDCL